MAGLYRVILHTLIHDSALSVSVIELLPFEVDVQVDIKWVCCHSNRMLSVRLFLEFTLRPVACQNFVPSLQSNWLIDQFIC